MSANEVESLLKQLAPLVLGILVRRHGQFDACEDATQEALVAAATSWPESGVPDSPKAWLVTVAQRRLVDEWRSESARRRREVETAALERADDPSHALDRDDTLDLLFLCCHPALSPASQLALTLRAVGGLSTAEIASALLVPEATMAQRISRAKATIRAAGAQFGELDSVEREERLSIVMRVIYLVFNEGYTASSGAAAHRTDLTAEAIRLGRMLLSAAPEPEVTGLLALMLLTDARRDARATVDGELVPLAEQDRTLWNRAAIDEGIALVTRALGSGPIGPYQLQAAIAAVHDEASSNDETDWPQILALYDVLSRVDPGPIVALNRAVAVAMVHGPRAGLAELGALDADDRMTHHHRVHAVRAHLLELAGESTAAVESYRLAARLARSIPEQRYLALRAARITP